MLEKTGSDAAVFGRKDNLSWISCGGSAEVAIRTELAAAILIITEGRTVLIAQEMDLRRIWEEQMTGLPEFELRPLRWNEHSPAAEAVRLLAGKRFLSDFPLGGGQCSPGLFWELHYPLTLQEQERYRKAALEAERIYLDVASATHPGLTELEVAAMLDRAFVAAGFDMVCHIIGSDDRLSAYRHPVATHKKIDKLLMLAPAVQKYGLTMPITRMIYYGGALPDDIARKYDAVCRIEAATLAMCRPGVRFSDILAAQVRLYEELGYPGEWERHAQGGLTGYIINDASKALDKTAVIRPGQSFNWYLTISGVKVEETALCGEQGAELISVGGRWPSKRYTYEDTCYDLPQIQLMQD